MGAVEDMMCVLCVSVTEGHSGDGCDLVSTLCKYDLRKDDLFVLSWVRVRRVSLPHDYLINSHACLLLFTPSCCCECFLSFVVACVLVLRCCECACCM